jgi:hypothetical protein
MATRPTTADTVQTRNDGLALLAAPELDDIFAAPSRTGVASAWHGHVPFAQWLVAAIAPRCIVELGTHNGVSFSAFCETVLRRRLETRCYAVDTWAGDDHAGHYGSRVYEEFRLFHDLRYGAFSELVRSTFDEACSYIPDGSVDLLHIDGFHSYEAVSHDFATWKAKLSPRAVVLFHDTNVIERDFGVARFWREISADRPAFEFLHGHGLGVLAWGAEVPEPLLRLCDDHDADGVSRLRERFAILGRLQMRDYAVEAAEARSADWQNERNALIEQATARDEVVEQLRQSLADVVALRDGLVEGERTLRQRADSAEARSLSMESEIKGYRAAQDSATTFATIAADEIKSLRAVVEHHVAETARRATAAETSAALIETLQAQLTQQEARIQALLRSRSWRLTAPLRMVKGERRGA